MSDALRFFTIYRGLADFPGQYVTVGWSARSNTEDATVYAVTPDPMPAAVVCSLETARAAVPPQHDFRLERSPEDDPNIVENWI